MTVSGSLWQRLYYRYYLGPDHPAKQRLCRCLSRILPGGRVVIPYHDGGRITVDERDHVERLILLHGCYEPEVFEALMGFADRHEVVWDIGAHVGSFTIRVMMDRRVDCSYAFEPLPATFRLLAGNISLNDGPCLLLNAGLSDRPEVRSLAPQAGNSSMATMTRPAAPDAVPVRCLSVDSLVQGGYAKSPTLMKIDVEGWEGRVLEGARQTFSMAPPKAVVFEAECDSQGRITNPDLTAFFEEFGYRVSPVDRPDGHLEPRENYLAELRA